MMSPDLLPEDRLRDALRAEAAAVEPADEFSLDTIRRRGRSAIARRRAVVGGLSAVVVAAGAFLAVSLLGDDDQTVVVDPGPEETTSTTVPEPTVTTVPSTTTPPPAAEQPYLWPPPGHAQYTDPVEAARSFVTEYVGFAGPQFGEVREAEPRLVEVDVLALGENGQPFGGRVWSTLQVAQAGDGTWRVRSAASEDVVIEDVEATDAAVTVTGRGTGFEGTLNGYAIDADGVRLGEPSIITVDCCAGLQPFESTIAVPERPASVLVISSTGLQAGSFFSAVPVASATSTGTAVSVYFVGLDGAVVPVLRSVTPPAVLNGALVALFDGPTADELARGLTTSLPANAGEFDPTATITAGIAHVDMPIGIAQPDPSQPAHTLPPDYARIMVEQMWRTVFQFDNISQVEFTLSGSCEDFGRWTGLGECRFDR
jgi:Sporulation and spore germination